MKKIFLLLIGIITIGKLRADEGMWLPHLIAQNIEQLQKLGCKLTADEIYSVNNGSLKDAIVQFGGGCTAELISKEGLLMTNHHCGYGSISSLSTVEKNYLRDGFVANTRMEELPVPGLTVKFLVRIEDVTSRVQKKIGDAYGEDVDKRLSEVEKEISEENSENGKYVCDVKDFFAGNRYLLLVYQIYKDVRLVAAPPESLGKFGGDTDNWMWPRHTCDFSMFRVYSDNSNQPAEYSVNNRPFHPKHYLPVSLKGVQQGDFAMVMGFPGRTTRYLTSYGIDLATTEYNPSIVKIRDRRLSTMRKYMEKDEKVDLDYSSQYASVANYWKYFIGQTEQLNHLRIYDQKREEERDFLRWANEDARYLKNIFNDYANAYAGYKPYLKHLIYLREGMGAPTLSQLAFGINSLYKQFTNAKDDKEKESYINRIKSYRSRLLKSWSRDMDQELFAQLNQMFYEDVPRAQHPAIFSEEVFRKFGSDNRTNTFSDYAEYVYSNTVLLNDSEFDKLCTIENFNRLMNDPMVKHVQSANDNYEDNYKKKYEDYLAERFELDRAYVGGLMVKNKGNVQMYPDANSTMRITYGSVKAYEPKDAVSFNFYTTADGLLEKYVPGDKEFDLQPKIVDLLKRRDFGDYADPKIKNLITCFITNNDITGGNSGSPVINANGEYIGSAFDGNWEAMSGDIAFDQRFKRTIIVDARYIMWVLDKVLGGRPLLDEMTIRN